MTQRAAAAFAAGTEYFALDVEDVPAASPRPDWLSAVSGPLERVQRHTVEQMGDCVPVVPLLDVPVPQLVDQLVVVLQGLDKFTPVEQGIEVPKITLEDGTPQRAVLREQLPVEQLAEVPVPESVVMRLIQEKILGSLRELVASQAQRFQVLPRVDRHTCECRVQNNNTNNQRGFVRSSALLCGLLLGCLLSIRVGVLSRRRC